MSANRKIADWTEGMLWSSVATTLIGLIGLVLIAFTLLEAQDTTKAALTAASHSERQADIAEDAYRRLERPYLFLLVSNTKWLTSIRLWTKTTPSVDFRVVNNGKTPAVLHWMSLGAQYNPTFPLISTMKVVRPRYEVIAPGDGIVEHEVEVVGWTAPATLVEVGNVEAFAKGIRGADCRNVVVYGIVAYSDPTGAAHIDSFCLRANDGCSSFRIELTGGLNKRETIYPGQPGYEEALIPPGHDSTA